MLQLCKSAAQCFVCYSACFTVNALVSLHLTLCWAGVYSETAFEGLDMVIDAAAQYGIRLIVTLSDSWNLVDSIKSVCACAVLHSPAAREPHGCGSQCSYVSLPAL